jgi:endonuclease YncB( thermonuclease family)
MKKFYSAVGFVFLALMLPTQAIAQKQIQGVVHDFKVTKVKDGDTVEIEAKFLPAPLKPVLSVRIYGVDTPEKGKRAQCPAEAQRGEMATKFTQQAVANAKEIKVVLYAWDKFGGRVLGDFMLDGQSLRQALIANNLAREYYGEAKQSWCN